MADSRERASAAVCLGARRCAAGGQSDEGSGDKQRGEFKATVAEWTDLAASSGNVGQLTEEILLRRRRWQGSVGTVVLELAVAMTTITTSSNDGKIRYNDGNYNGSTACVVVQVGMPAGMIVMDKVPSQ